MARGYTSFALADPIPAEPEARGWAGSAGAIWSTPTDLLTWDLSLLEHTLISDSSYKVLATAQRLTDGRSSGYGCGEGVNDRGQAVVLSHGGAVSGFVAQNTVIPATRSAVVLLSNTDFSPIGALNQELVSKLMPRGVDVPAIKGLAALEAAKKFLTELEKGSVDVVTFTSASAVHGYVDAVGPELARRAKGASIGPVTSEAARAAGIDVAAEASEATIPSLVEAVVALLGDSGGEWTSDGVRASARSEDA